MRSMKSNIWRQRSIRSLSSSWRTSDRHGMTKLPIADCHRRSRFPFQSNRRSLVSGSDSRPLQETQDARYSIDDSPLSAGSSASKPSSPTRAYLDLAKAWLSLLVVTTSAAGFIAAGGPLSSQLDVLGACLVGTGLCSASAAAINQVLEIPQDSRMKRTQLRPLVTGALSKRQATQAAVIWAASGTSLLYLGTDPLTTALGANVRRS